MTWSSSAGNHGLGLAYAPSKPAPGDRHRSHGASAAKVSALQQFDVRLVLHGDGYREAETHALSWPRPREAVTSRPTTTRT